MFLQNILQKRLKDLNEEEERYLTMSAGMHSKGALQGAGQGILSGGLGFQTDGFDKTAKTIGSIKNRQVNFLPEHTFFNTQTHMRPQANYIRHIVKDEIDKDLLGTKPAKWTQSVACSTKIGMNDAQGGRQGMAGDFRELQNNALRFNIRQGFLDQVATDANPQTTYAGCDTRDVYYHGWDVSIEKTPPRDKERQYQIERAYICDKTVRTGEGLVRRMDGQDRTVYGIKTSSYLQPEQITREINEKLRREKADEVHLWDELMNKQRFEMPGASQNRLDAIVHKKIQDIKHGKKEEPDPELTFKPFIGVSQASKGPAPEKPKKRGFRGNASATNKSSLKDTIQEKQQPVESDSDQY